MFHFHSAKNNELSEVFRNEGNKFYKSGQFFEAMKGYNRSLCYAKVDSEHMALAYGNRSAVYLETGEYERCLENIQMARKAGFPKAKLERLAERETQCKKLMETRQPDTDDDPWTFFKLSYPPNEKLPFIANCLELNENLTHGRHIIASHDLKPGDIIALEETPFQALNREGAYIRCANCLKSNKMNLISSEECSQVMYCSTSCLEYGKGKYMCAADEHFGLVPRILFQVLAYFDGDIEKMKVSMDITNLSSSKSTIFDFDMSKPDDPKRLLQQYIAMNSLYKDNTSKALNQLIENHPILDTWSSKNDKEIAKIFMKSITDLVVNSLGFEWRELYQTGGKYRYKDLLFKQSVCIGNGIFLFSSLFNHSCSHNVDRIIVDNKMVMWVHKPIKKGEQLFINYGTNFEMVDKSERQEYLKKFDFVCRCEACKGNWQTLPNLKKKDRKFKPPGVVVDSIASAKEELSMNFLYISKNFKKFPSFEICSLIDRNFYLLSVIGKLEPCLF